LVNVRSDLPIVASRQPYTCISVPKMSSYAHKDCLKGCSFSALKDFVCYPVPVKTVQIAQVARTNSAEKVSSLQRSR
jgi:hypothetical protein